MAILATGTIPTSPQPTEPPPLVQGDPMEGSMAVSFPSQTDPQQCRCWCSTVCTIENNVADETSQFNNNNQPSLLLSTSLPSLSLTSLAKNDINNLSIINNTHTVDNTNPWACICHQPASHAPSITSVYITNWLNTQWIHCPTPLQFTHQH